MSEEQGSAAPPRRRTPAEAAQLVAEYEASGLSKAEFCQGRELAISTLDAYRGGRRLGLRERSPAPRWVAVEVKDAQRSRTAAAASGLALVLGKGRRIEVGLGFDAATLEQLLSVLERA
jgi:hypothetical protein